MGGGARVGRLVMQLWGAYLEMGTWRASMVQVVLRQVTGIDTIDSLSLGSHCGDKGRPGSIG